MSRTLVVACALAFAGFAAQANAADLNVGSVKDLPQDVSSFKDPLPDSLTWHGVTFYGTVDVGYAYQTNGLPLGGVVSDLEYSPFTTTRNFTGQSVSTFTANALEQSKIGVKIEEEHRLWLHRHRQARHRLQSADSRAHQRLQLLGPEHWRGLQPPDLQRR